MWYFLYNFSVKTLSAPSTSTACTQTLQVSAFLKLRLFSWSPELPKASACTYHPFPAITPTASPRNGPHNPTGSMAADARLGQAGADPGVQSRTPLPVEPGPTLAWLPPRVNSQPHFPQRSELQQQRVWFPEGMDNSFIFCITCSSHCFLAVCGVLYGGYQHWFFS